MSRLAGALRAAWRPSVIMMLVYAITVTVGALMAHQGNRLALGARDAIVAHALNVDPASRAYARDSRWEAAAWDFSRNLVLGGVSSTVLGLAIVLPYGTAAYRGWVGGIVAVDGKHRSRLHDPRSALYYLLTLLLQLVPYSLAGGAGVRLGLRYLRSSASRRQRWLGLPRDALADALWIYALVVPLFLVDSIWEFLSSWNL